ncbi:MAG: HlyD family efflux transporter periplasmic adaptor subunit [Methyloceanibacter sp.]|jgi:multidrug efflux pump subunit AcrA (membrane-fusion protein)
MGITIGRTFIWFAVAVACSVIAGCDDRSEEVTARPARPVSYVSLETSNPSRTTLVAGSVGSWKKELVGFQVDGRVNYVREPGENIDGRILTKEGEVLEGGTLLASLESERYRIRVGEAEARVRSSEAKAQSVRTEVQETIPNELKEMQAEVDRSSKEFERQDRLLKTGTGTQKKADEARAAFRAASARLAQVQSRLGEAEAELASAEAQVIEAQQSLREAKRDLIDTELYSPFKGQISKVHVIPGGYVKRGQPVMTVQMMDPIKVQVAVSAETDRGINYNDILKIYTDDASEPIDGWVHHKDAVADASTRTFMVTLLVRNRQVEVDAPESQAAEKIYRIDDIWDIVSESGDGKPPYFVNEAILHEDADGYFVWKAEGLTLPDLKGSFDPVFTVKKVRVRMGERRMPFLEIWTFREVADLGGLDPAKDLLASRLPPETKEGDHIFLSRKRWLLRPGELVRVDLRSGQLAEGFYVPAQAILKDGPDHYVFTVSEQENGEELAVKVAVKLGSTLGTLQGIEPVSDGELTDGMKLIVDGAHYLRDGERVNAFFEVEQES